MSQSMREEIKVRAREVGDKLNELIREGNVRRVIVKNERGEKVIEIPLSLGLVGVVAAPLVAAIGAAAGVAAQWRIEIVRRAPSDEGEGKAPG